MRAPSDLDLRTGRPSEEIAPPLITEPIDSLISRSCKGDRDAQQQIYERHHGSAYRLLIRMVGHTDAADVLQEVFLQVFRTLNQFSGKSQFETWLYRLTLNQALQYLRQRRRSRWTTLESDLMDRHADQTSRMEDKELLECALARLEPDLRASFLLREVEKLSYSEISKVTEVPEGTVASRLNRARQLLKEHLMELGWDQ